MKPFFILTAVLLLPTTIASAAGIQVSPAKLEFNITGNSSVSKEIVVANPTADVQLFEISADDFTNAISANPESVTLEAGTRKTVNVTVDPKNLPHNQSQLLGTDLSVVSTPLGSQNLGVGAGVKLPVTISFSPALKNNLTPLIYYGVPVLVLAVLLTAWFVKKRWT